MKPAGIFPSASWFIGSLSGSLWRKIPNKISFAYASPIKIAQKGVLQNFLQPAPLKVLQNLLQNNLEVNKIE